MAVMAKGARRPKSRFGSTLQPLGYVQAVYYYREARGLQTLKEAAHVQRWKHTLASLDRTTAGLRIIELVRALTLEGEANPPLFRLLLDHLTALDLAPGEPYGVLPHFQLAFARLLGFSPDVKREEVEAVGDEGGVLRLESGGVGTLAEASHAGVRASRAALRAFAIYARVDLPTALRLTLDPETRAEVGALADAFLKHHTADAFPDRVRGVAQQMEAGRAG